MKGVGAHWGIGAHAGAEELPGGCRPEKKALHTSGDLAGHHPVACRPDTPLPPSHSSSSRLLLQAGRFLRRDGFRAACTTTAWAGVLRV
eukprot:scaffold16587_cov141-Isochrysis_galbana.AAC.7